jgi:hypothetical protein
MRQPRSIPQGETAAAEAALGKLNYFIQMLQLEFSVATSSRSNTTSVY